MEQLKNLVLRALESIREFRSTNRQLFNLIAVAVGLAFGMCALLYAFDPGAPVVLASNLSSADRTALALRLRRQRIDFTLGTDSVSVPSREIGQARRILEASPGFPGGHDDFSLFDHSTMGQSDFDEQVNYQRSLQGELERTLMDIHGIDNARVMLAMNNSSAFGLAPAQAERASVMLAVAPGAVLDGSMARAIAHLVAGSVRGLSAENVTITGNDGEIFYPPQREGEFGEAIRLRNDFEHRLQGKAEALLTRIMGQNRYAVEVAVDVDTSQLTKEDSLYGKGDHAILSEEHSQTPAEPPVGGIPGLTSNLPTPAPSPVAKGGTKTVAKGNVPAAVATPQMARKDIINYKPSRRQIKTVTAPVRIKQITVAAVLDGTYEGGRFTPLPDERLNAIKGLLAAAVGAQRERGDSVDVQSAALSQPYVPPVPNPITEVRAWLNQPMHMFEAAGAAVVALVLLVLVAKRAISMVGGSRAKAPTAKVDAIVLESPLSEEQAPEEPAAAPQPDTFDSVRSQINQQVESDPLAAAEVVRKWLIPQNGNNHVHEQGDNA